MHDYFESFASVNEERRNERETDGEKATTEKGRSASSKSTNDEQSLIVELKGLWINNNRLSFARVTLFLPA